MEKTLKSLDVIEASRKLNRGSKGLSKVLSEVESALTEANYPRSSNGPEAHEMAQAQTYWLCKIADNFLRSGEDNISCKYTPFNDFNEYHGPVSGFYKETKAYNPADHIEAAKKAGLKVVPGISEE